MNPLLSMIEAFGFLMLISFLLCACFGWCLAGRQKRNGVVLAPPEPDLIVVHQPIASSANTERHNSNTCMQGSQRFVK